MNPYNPVDPKIGDLVYLGSSGAVDLTRIQDLEETTGAVTARIRPEHSGLINYKIEITLHSGRKIQDLSQNWRCLRTHVASTRAYLKKSCDIVGDLERLINKDVAEM